MEYINRYYFQILIIIIASIFRDLFIGINHNSTFSEVNLSFGLSKHYLIHEFWNYILTFFISIFLSKKENTHSAVKSNTEPKRGWIKLIYHNSKNSNYDLTYKFLFNYLLIIFFWVLVDQLLDDSFIMIFQDLDFWMIEFIILSLLNKHMSYKIRIYRHQICAMLLCIFPSLFKVCSIYLSFQDKSEDKNNYTGHLPIYYTTNNETFKIIFGVLFYIILITLRSYVNLKLKWHMDIKYISHYKILTAFGSIGSFIYLLICIISTFIKCKEGEFCKYLGKVEYKNSYYFDSIKIYWEDLKFEEIFVVFVGFLAFFFKKLYTILVIKNLTPVHVIFSVPFRYLIQKVISISYSLIKREYSKNKYKIYKLILDTSGDIFSCLGFLIYLEIIAIKFCNLDYDIKNNIMRRSFADTRKANNENEFFYNNEIIDENLGIKEISDDNKVLFDENL